MAAVEEDLQPSLRDLDLCRRAKAGDPLAQKELCAAGLGLVRWRIHRVIGSGRFPPNVSPEDAEQEGMLALWRALQTWDGVRAFTTLAVLCIDRQIRRWRSSVFPALHTSRNAFAAAHGHTPSTVALDAPTLDRSIYDLLPDSSLTGCNPLDWVEALDAVHEHAARPARTRRRRPCSRQRLLPVSLTVVPLKGTNWNAVCIAFPGTPEPMAPRPRAPRRPRQAPVVYAAPLFDVNLMAA